MTISRLPLILVTGLVASSAWAQEMPTVPAAPVTAPVAAAGGEAVVRGERIATATVTATVTAIDYVTREVTLKGPAGNEISIVAGPAIKRLNEILVGDQVTADYLVSLAGELRAPTDEERQHPLVVLEDAGRAPTDQAPAGAAVRSIRAVAKVVALDLENQTVTLQGPRGNRLVTTAKPENLAKAHLGDTVVVTYTEALAISLEKAVPAAK